MADVTITGLSAVLAANLDDTAVIELDDKNGNTRKATVAQLRAQILSGAPLAIASPVALASTLSAAGGNLTVGATGLVNVKGALAGYEISRRDTNAPAWTWYSAAGNLQLYDAAAAVDRLIAAAGGQILVGTTVTTAANAGELVLANGKALRGVGVAGTSSGELIKRSSVNDQIVLGGQSDVLDSGDLIRISYWNMGSLPGGSAARNGTIVIDGTNNRIIYYAGGNRYAVPIGAVV